MEENIKEELHVDDVSYSLYKIEWVEQAADEGYKEFMGNIRNSLVKEEVLDMPVVQKVLAVLYYSSFESALNTFLSQVLKDSLHQVELTLDELCKVTARMKKKGE